VTGWSEGARTLTGYLAEEVVGRPAADLLAEEVPSATLAARAGRIVLRHRAEGTVALTVSACPLLGPDGSDAGYVITTERRREGPEATIAAQAFEQASMSMSVFDTHQRYLRLNAAACRVMGVPEEVLLGRPFPETVEDAEHSRGSANWSPLPSATANPPFSSG